MRYALTFPGFTIAAGAVLWALAVDVFHPAAAELTAAEAVCQVRASRNALATLSRRYAKCLFKCAGHADSRSLAAQQCLRASACGVGPTDPTCRCIEYAIAQAVDHEAAGCLDCPECYVGGGDPNPDCTPDASSKADAVGVWSESLFFSGSPAVFCDDTPSPDGLTIPEVRCQLSTAKTLAVLSRQAARCHSTCRVAERAGLTPPGSCDAPLLTNPNAQQAAKGCVQSAGATAALRIDKQCGIAGENRPQCYGATNGAGWVAMEESFIDGQDASYFCDH